MTVPRKLPVLQSAAGDPERRVSRFQWMLVTAACSLFIWLPFAWFSAKLGVVLCTAYMGASDADALSRALSTATPAVRALALGLQVLPLLLSFALAVTVSGVLVGRFGGKAGVREAVLGGLLCVLFVVLLVAFTDRSTGLRGVLAALMALSLVACLAAWAGVRLGQWGERRSGGR